MRISRKHVSYGSWALVIATLVACLLVLSSCGHPQHQHHRRRHTVDLSSLQPVGEFIGTLNICWPNSWGEEEKADGRRGILAHLNAWEAEFGVMAKPAKLIVFLTDDQLVGVNLEDPSIILVAPGECFEFEALFNLLVHYCLDEPGELDPGWERWNSIGETVAEDLRQLCVIHQPPAPDPEPEPDPEPDCEQLVQKWLQECRPGMFGWIKGRHSKHWHKHWHKHWKPKKHECKKLWELLKSCKEHDGED